MRVVYCMSLTHLPRSPPAASHTNAPSVFQPPLQYYLHVLAAKKWDDVTILTVSWKDRPLNPTYNVLEVMADSGTLGHNVRLFHVSRN